MKRLRLLIPMVALALVLFAVGCSSESPESSGLSEAELTFQDGLHANEAELYKEAISHFDKAIQLDPEFAEAYAERAVSYSLLGQYQTAITDLDKAIQIDPNLAIAWNNRGYAYAYLSQHQNAVTDFTRAIQLNAADAWTYHGRGRSYGELGKSALSEKDFAKACQLDRSLC
jgi:tetratricopeptide (TPR) repeat protein